MELVYGEQRDNLTKKQLIIELDFQETLRLYKLEDGTIGNIGIVEELSNALYNFGKYSNSQKETDKYSLVMTIAEGQSLIEEIDGIARLNSVKEKLEKELINIGKLSVVYVVTYTESKMDEPDSFSVVGVHENLLCAIKQAENYDVEIDIDLQNIEPIKQWESILFSNNEDIYTMKYIEIKKMPVVY